MALNLNSCSNDCINCIKKYCKKHQLKKNDKFKISCNGIPSESEQLSLFARLPEKDRGAARVIMDPVVWAAETLDWHCLDPDGSVWKRKNFDEWQDWMNKNPGKNIFGHSRYHRPYQAEMLRCSARRKVFRIGRQCLTGDTLITLADYTTKPIKDIKPGDKILSLDLHDIISTTVIDHWNAGVKPVYKITTKFGKVITATSDHRFLLCKQAVDRKNNRPIDKIDPEWLSIDTGLCIGDKIAVNAYGGRPKGTDVGLLASFLGFFLSDGSCSVGQSAKFTNTNIDYLLRFENLCKEIGTNVRWYRKGKGYDLIITNGRGKRNPVRDLLHNLKLSNITGPDKFIPEILLNSTESNVIEFLRAFWAGDGYISTFQRAGRQTYRTEIGTLQESLMLIKQIQHLLLTFGVHGYIKKEGNCYRLVISNKFSVKNFLLRIGPIPGKEHACAKAEENLSKMTDKYLHVQNDVLWDYVSKIEKIGYEETFDIEVSDTHNFIANGIFTHNSGKTEALVVSMLYHLFTKPGVPETEGFEIVVITPFQAQIDVIFTRILQLIRGSAVTNNSLKRSIKSPVYTIQLHNESIVKGFTAGTKSGGNADAVRGQHAHMLVFDEADYLATKDMESAFSIITNYPTASVWMSSTPSGKREKFYDQCHSMLFKEFYFPSHTNPMWNESLELFFRENLTDTAFKHEILAEFGEQEEGVFQNVHVQAAKANYKYGAIPRQSTWTYSFGVDWNDVKNGTTIVVIGFNPSTNKFMVVDRHTISKEGWTQLAACHKIAELNRAWKPEFIYIDAGHGGTQYEVLRKYGYDSVIDPQKGPKHPDARLRDIVKKYDFGSKVETRDLFTHQPMKKDAKPFLVESTVRRFESCDIKFPESDDLLERQLLGYIIDRITPSGRPVYKANDEVAGDHVLDALMLAMLAFVLEVSPLGKPKYKSSIAITGRFGQGIDLAHQGDTVVVARTPSEYAREQRERQKPTSGRGDLEQQSLFSRNELPANNMNQNSHQAKLWSHEGFLRDEPRPKVRTLGEAGQEARRRLGIRPRMGGRPRRKNI